MSAWSMSDQTPTPERFDLVSALRMTGHRVGIDAADEIERLRAEIEDLMNALWKACGDDEDAVAECLGGVS